VTPKIGHFGPLFSAVGEDFSQKIGRAGRGVCADLFFWLAEFVKQTVQSLRHNIVVDVGFGFSQTGYLCSVSASYGFTTPFSAIFLLTTG
jgi:hypothetical protein